MCRRTQARRRVPHGHEVDGCDGDEGEGELPGEDEHDGEADEDLGSRRGGLDALLHDDTADLSGARDAALDVADPACGEI